MRTAGVVLPLAGFVLAAVAILWSVLQARDDALSQGAHSGPTTQASGWNGDSERRAGPPPEDVDLALTSSSILQDSRTEQSVDSAVLLRVEVTMPDDLAVPGARVLVRTAGDGVFAREVLAEYSTDQRGIVEFSTAQDCLALLATVPAESLLSNELVVQVAAGPTTPQSVRMRLHAGCMTQGRVVDRDGVGRSGIGVSAAFRTATLAATDNGTPVMSASTTTDLVGNFSLLLDRNALYLLTAKLDDEHLRMEIRDHRICSGLITLEPTPLAPIRGEVVECWNAQPVRAAVEVWQRMSDEGTQPLRLVEKVPTDPAGQFTTSGLPKAEYTLIASTSDGRCSASKRVGHEADDAVQTAGGVTLCIAEESVLRGIVMIDNTAVDDAHVIAERVRSLIDYSIGPTSAVVEKAEGRTNADGVFTIIGVTPGEWYDIRAIPGLSRGCDGRLHDVGGGEMVEVSCSCSAVASIVGEAVLPVDAGVGSCVVELWRRSTKKGWVPKPDYRLAIPGSAFELQNLTVGETYALRVELNGIDYDCGPFVLGSGQNRITFQLPLVNGTVILDTEAVWSQLTKAPVVRLSPRGWLPGGSDFMRESEVLGPSTVAVRHIPPGAYEVYVENGAEVATAVIDVEPGLVHSVALIPR